jgi:hypothetical protein
VEIVRAEQVPESADAISPPESVVRPAVVGATVGALVNAALWTSVSALLNLEAGALATLAGVCTGVGVAVSTRGDSGNVSRLIAVLGSLASILVGKYGSYWFLLRKSIIDQLGESAAVNAHPWSQGVVVSFVAHWRESFTTFDIVWVALAVSQRGNVPLSPREMCRQGEIERSLLRGNGGEQRAGSRKSCWCEHPDSRLG